MFEKFNSAARGTVRMAKDVADSSNQNHLGTGHMLLSIAAGAASGASPVAGAVITALGTTAETIRDQTAPLLERGSGAGYGYLPFTPNMKQALEFALRSSMMLGDDHIGPEHLLAGLAGSADSTAGKILAGLGITVENRLPVTFWWL